MEFTSKHDIDLSNEIFASTTIEIFNFSVPPSAKAKITAFANRLNEFDAWGLVMWIFKKNGITLYPYNDITDQIAMGAPLRELEGTELIGGDVFSIDIKNDYIDVVKAGISLKWEIYG